MGILVIGLVLFFGVHSVSIVARPWRDAMVARIGEVPWKGVYALIAIAGLVLIVQGYGLARQAPVVVYEPPGSLRLVALALLLPVFPLLVAAYLPTRLRAALKHPMLVATKLWALAHLLVNGTLADLLLFGGFLVWAAADRIAVARREPRRIPVAPESLRNDLIAVLAGFAVYALVLWQAHAWLTGTDLIPS